MTPDVIAQFMVQFGLVPTLVIYLVYSDRKERKVERDKSQEREILHAKYSELEREKAQSRESKLMDHIVKSDENMSKFSESLSELSKTLNAIDRSMGYLQRDVEDLKIKK